jgi:hypothetical protein
MAAKPKTSKSRAENIVSPEDQSPVEPTLAVVDAVIASPKRLTGRPTTFDQYIADLICIRLAEGQSLREVLKNNGMPAQSTVYEWLLRHPSFAEQYTRAREEQADTLADEIIAIADEQPEIIAVVDKRTGELIEHKLDGAFLQWQKNRIDARKWTAMKLKPKKYGEKVQLSGDAENPMQTKITFDSFDVLLETIEARRQEKAHG